MGQFAVAILVLVLAAGESKQIFFLLLLPLDIVSTHFQSILIYYHANYDYLYKSEVNVQIRVGWES